MLTNPRSEVKNIINRLHCADDNALVAETEETLRNLIHRLSCLQNVGLRMNAEKIERLGTRHDSIVHSRCPIELDDGNVKVTNEFKYLSGALRSV